MSREKIPTPMSLGQISKRSDDNESVLPPLPPDHGFTDGDRVQIPVWGQGDVLGTIRYIDITFAGKRYKGFAVLGDDGRYYELVPDLAHKIDTTS